MLKNSLGSSLKYLFKHKLFSVSNVIGISTALCVCFFVLIYVRFELSYDAYHKRADNIYRLVTDVQTSTGVGYQSTSAPMGPAIEKTFPQVEAFTRVFLDYMLVQKDEANFNEEKLAYADSTLFSVFTFPLISGEAKTALDAPFKLVISESGARRYFGTADVLNKTLLLDGKYPAIIGGVMKDIPSNSHFKVDIILSMATLLKEFNPPRAANWELFGFYTYVVVPSDINIPKLSDEITKFAGTKMSKESKYRLQLEPLKSVYLEGKPRGWRTGSSASGNMRNLYILGFVAVLVLIVACINFINLATAFSFKRAREMSLRKALGGTRQQLVFLFALDCLILSFIAFMLAIAVSAMLLPVFNQVVGNVLDESIFRYPGEVILVFMIALGIGALSGLYPALHLSHLTPFGGLGGQFNSGTRAAIIRQGLVVFQFTISILIIVATIVVYRQLDFMQNADLGFNKANKLIVDFHFDDRIRGAVDPVKRQLQELKGFDLVSISGSVPGKQTRKTSIRVQSAYQTNYEVEWDLYPIDYDFLQQYNISVVAGRAFSKDFASDSVNSIIINEAAVKTLGFANAEDVIGKNYWQGDKPGTIVGVIKDFTFDSFREDVQPLTFKVLPRLFTFITLTGNSQNLFAGIDALQSKWRDLAPGLPLNFHFSDDTFHEMYKSERQFRTLFVCFSIIAISISSLGLMALSTLSITQRLKEISIRKIVGATSWNIMRKLLIDLLKPVIIAMAFAIPAAWWLMHNWLENYAYRITLSWTIFLLAGILSLAIAVLTVLLTTINASLVNPAKILRNG